MPLSTALSQSPRQVPFAVYTHRPGSIINKYLWYECYNNDIDPQPYLDLITQLNLVKTNSTTLHLGYIDSVDLTVMLTVNLYDLDDINTRKQLWLNAERLTRLESGYALLIDMLHSP